MMFKWTCYNQLEEIDGGKTGKIMTKFEPGTVVTLDVVREAPFGYFLSDGEKDVLLHHTEIPEDFNENIEQTVFLYQDHEGRLAASPTIPTIRKGHYDWAEVVEVKKSLGVFIDIGIQKDILISMDDLPELFHLWPVVGNKLYCSLKTDRKNRLFGKIAPEDIMREIAVPATRQLHNKNVSATVYRLLLEGSFVITDEGYLGFIHQSERKAEPRLGEQVRGRVIDVKEDGFINISLMPRSHEVIDVHAEQIYEYLLSRDGSMPFSDKSMPEDIRNRFHMSKGAFKRALGKLMREGKVTQQDGWTYTSNRKTTS